MNVPPEVLSFVDAMREAGEFYDAGELATFYEKPWQWEPDYLAWLNHGEPMDDSCPGWDAWVDALAAFA